MYGVSIEADRRTFVSPLHSAIRGGQMKAVRWLLNLGADRTSTSGGFYVNRGYILKAELVALALFSEQHDIAILLVTHSKDLFQG